MAADRSRLAAALAYEEERRRRMMESVPGLVTTPAQPAPSADFRTNLENLSIGLGRGVTTGLEGVKGIITDPVGTAKGVYETGKTVIRDPSVIADALRYTAEKATSGSLGAGEVIGEMVSPTRGAGGVGKRDIFIGKSAKTYDPTAEQRAIEMEKAGVDRDTIWRETGTGRAFGPEWKQEISDIGADLDFEKVPVRQNAFDWADRYLVNRGFRPIPGGLYFSPIVPDDVKKEALEYGKEMSRFVDAVPLESAFRHQELRQAYPEMFNELRVGREISPVARGQYVEENKLVTTGGGQTTNRLPGMTRNEETSTLLHELQHAIQSKEGFARGGDPSMARKAVQEEFKTAVSPYAEAMSMRRDASGRAGEAYRADYAHKLQRMQQQENIKPAQLRRMSDWYQYHREVSGELEKMGLGWKMPTKAGAKRDEWINTATKVMQRLIERDRPEMVGAAQRMTEKQAKNLLARTDRVFRKTQEAAIQESKVREKAQRLGEMGDFELYQRLAGEAEARATQARQRMTAMERRQIPPWKSLDVPEQDLVILRR